MDPALSAIIGAVAAGVATTVITVVGKLFDGRQETARERRRRREEALEKLADNVRLRGVDDALLRISTGVVGDEELTAHVGKVIVAASAEERSNAQGDAAYRIGQLLGSL